MEEGLHGRHEEYEFACHLSPLRMTSGPVDIKEQVDTHTNHAVVPLVFYCHDNMDTK